MVNRTAIGIRLLAGFAPQDGRVLAGGQSLVPMMNFRLARQAFLIDINAVAGLDRLAVEDRVLRIGARVRHAAFDRPLQLKPDELLTEARLPILPASTRFGFAEFSRRAGDFTMAMALAVLEIEEDVIASARIGVGGAEAIPAPPRRSRSSPARREPGRGGLPRRGSGCCGGD